MSDELFFAELIKSGQLKRISIDFLTKAEQNSFKILSEFIN